MWHCRLLTSSLPHPHLSRTSLHFVSPSLTCLLLLYGLRHTLPPSNHPFLHIVLHSPSSLQSCTSACLAEAQPRSTPTALLSDEYLFPSTDHDTQCHVYRTQSHLSSSMSTIFLSSHTNAQLTSALLRDFVRFCVHRFLSLTHTLCFTPFPR